VCINDILSDNVTIYIGGHQGSVLSAAHFIMYTNALRYQFHNCVLIKYADDNDVSHIICH